MSDAETYDEGKDRAHKLYDLLLEELEIGQNTLAAELEKEPADRDAHYMIGQERLNVALENAIIALAHSGAIDEEKVADAVRRPVDASQLN